MKKILIVGGVAGGATAAARLRRNDEEAQIIMFERGEYISFANCGLPYYIGGVIPQRDSLLVQTVQGMSDRFAMDIRIQSQVTEIHPDSKNIQVKNLLTGEVYTETYDYLILSPGANPIKPPIPGIEEANNIFVVRTIPDTDAIKAFVDNKKPRTATVVGGGFIGIEMAENLAHRGIQVTLVEMQDQVMAPFDIEMAQILHSHMKSKGVNLILSDGVSQFENNGKTIRLKSGAEVPSDLTILAIGVAPENELAKKAGLTLGKRGHILVNNKLQTSNPSIFAIGDAIEAPDYLTGTSRAIPLASPANKQGRIVADIIAGKNVTYTGALGTSVAKVFDLTAASTGYNEKTLQAEKIKNYETIHIHPGSHAGYYPGALPISLKLIFDTHKGNILGAQAIGYDGVEKRIDVIATAIHGQLDVRNLAELELSYAPPFSSAKDPVNMAGYVASNILDDSVKIVHFNEIDSLVEKGAFLIDVREPQERDLGFIPGSVNIPLNQLRSRLSEIPTNKEIIVSCQVGLRGYVASRILQQHGIQAKNLDGGYKTYSQAFDKTPVANTCCSTVNDRGEMEVHCETDPQDMGVDLTIDARGLQCPGPISQVNSGIASLADGQVLEILTSDPGFVSDIDTWCKKTGNTLLSSEFEKTHFRSVIRKGTTASVENPVATNAGNGATLVVFSEELDKAMASLIIATGAASMGKEVTMFYTFWGLNILRKSDVSVKKDTLSTMFSKMMPNGPKNLPLSNMNMMGIGAKMMNYVMKEKNVDSVETLLHNAMAMGVKMIACSMSMDVMGITKEELIDGVEIAGVATYLGKTDEGNLNLFI